MPTGFDFSAYRSAVEGLDVERWLGFYADDAEWLEYRQANPPRAPNIMRGKAAIGQFVRAIAAAGIGLAIEREVIDDRRAR
jgi:ketosteroid isomerase-like protein